ncbi:MAG TPA: class I adenylate-forming enzyme family protein [Pseudonocardia sp.]|nr:class I adenylate-forming enzyme family protein [Pseudonocardia sp.]
MAIGPTGTDTVWSLYRRCADSHAHSALLFVDDTGAVHTTPWTDLAARAGRIAAGLRAAGIRHGDRVALLDANSPTFPALLGATSLLGAIAVPLNVLLAPPELAYQLGDVEPAALIAGPRFAAAGQRAVDIAGVTPARYAVGQPLDGWAPLPEHGQPLAGPPDRVDHMDPFQILFTSGTTSRPKGVLHSHRNIVEESLRQVYQWSLGPDDVVFTHMPLFHVAGQNLVLFPAMSVGAGTAIGGAFSAGRWADDLRSTGATVAAVAGAQIRMIMAQPGKPTDGRNELRLIPTGIAVPADMEAAFVERFGAPVRAISGSTESIAVSYCEPVWGEHRHPALGRPTFGKQVEIRDEDGNPLPAGRPGELCVRGTPGAEVMLGYWNRPEETAKALVDGWLHTGDIGVADEDGYLFFVDRKKDIIKRAGENVSASEVERVLLELGGVREAAVVGRPDPIRDEAVVAFVVLDSDGPSVEKMIEHCAENLAGFKVPEEIIVLDSLPVTSIGKIEKATLRERAKAGQST